MRDENQLHAAVVELVALDDAEIKYSTVQNWYPGDKDGKGGIYNFVTKRGKCAGVNSKISWTQVETGSAITWKYPSCILLGDGSVGEFYSVAVTNNHQQADTGTKMIHIGKNTKSTIVSKGISAGTRSERLPRARAYRPGSRGRAQLLPVRLAAHRRQVRCPHLPLHRRARTPTAQMEHEATTSKISEDQLFYFQLTGHRQRGRGQHDRERLLQGGLQGAPDGVRGGGPEAARRQPRRQRRLDRSSSPTLGLARGTLLQSIRTSSTRRFCCRPASVSLESLG